MNLKKLILTNNECYKVGKKISVKGIMVHSTGANNPWLKRYVGPDDGLLGTNKNGNHWNTYRPGGRQVCVHAFIGKLNDGSNLHREHLLPSEKAFAYKMKVEAMNRQGERTDLTCSQVGKRLNTYEVIAEESGESRNQIHRYIRLTNLLPELLKYVDDGQISFTPAVELSYLNDIEQRDLLQAMELNDCTPSLSQAVRMKKLSQAGKLDDDRINKIMAEEKANQKERIKIPTERVRKYFPKSFSNSQIEDEIVKLCEVHYKRRQRQQER